MIPDLFTIIPADKTSAADSKPATKVQTEVPIEVSTEVPIKVPIVASLPHSGLQVPDEIAACFSEQHLRTLPNSDWHLQPLYSFLPSLGITVLQANYSRYVVDLNRALKPPFFGSFWSAVVPEQTAFKQAIYKAGHQPSQAQVRSRIETYYTPYHQALTALLNEAIAQHGSVYLLDLHSFMGIITDDVCLGNAQGTTCTDKFLELVADSFAHRGYGVVKNKVFTGGHITRHYGQQPGVEALQVEIRYPIYLPADQIADPCASASAPMPIPSYQSTLFTQAQKNLRSVFSQIVAGLP